MEIMDNKLFNTQVDGSLSIFVDSELFKTISRAKTWYTNKNLSFVGIILLGFIDIVGFFQAFVGTANINDLQKVIIVSAFAIAFEVAPLYIGYALSLKCYGLGKKIHNWVLSFSTTACFLGVIGNIIFRSLTLNDIIQSKNAPSPEAALAITITMCILPVITSLVNLVIGCLTFDPLLFDLTRSEKKLRVLTVKKRQLESAIEALSHDDEAKKCLIGEENDCYTSTQREINTARQRFRNYILARTSSVYEE